MVLILTLPAMGRTVLVGSKEDFPSIGGALAGATPHDTVKITGGTYMESGLTVTFPLVILGLGKPVIDGAGNGQIMTVTSSEVVIDGIVFQNSGISFIEDISALKLEGASRGRIENCEFVNNFFALYLAECSDVVIRNNTIGGEAVTESRSGNGIHLWYCRNITIEGNSVAGHRDGIYLEFVEQSSITNNMSHDNLRYGLHFMFSNKNSYRSNRFISNGSGTAVMYSRHVDMVDNDFADNLGPAAYGILIKDIYDSTIHNNRIRGNSTGLYSEASNRVSVRGNRFEENGWAVKVMANSMDNTFSGNSFLHNSFDVATNSRQNFNSFNGNYYSRYNGYDLNRDGFGDLPYRPVTLFSFLIERNEPVLILLNSAFVDLLNLAESVMPILVPETLVDQHPLMVMP